MTLYRATVVDTPGDPFIGDPADALAADSDGGLLVRDGVIAARGSYPALRAEHPDEPLVELTGGLLLPGFVDTHVHYPQLRVIGGLGMPLLDWLEQVRAARGEPARRSRVRRAAGAGVRRRTRRAAGPPRRWCSDRTSNRRWTSCSPPHRTPG